MTTKYLISIIIPIYNAVTYLSETIDSIIRQTIGFENLELILVDDKSTDGTKSVIEKYALKYNNIKPIYLSENSGFPGFVRNKGMEVAAAEYIMFIDSDDEYEIDICEQFYNTITKDNCDLVSCKYIHIDYLNRSLKENKLPVIKKTHIDLDDILYNTDLFIWNKIFKKSIITKNNLKFVTDRVGEDTFFCIEYFIHSNCVINLNNYYGYKYFNRGESFSTTNLKWNLNVINHHYETLDLLNENHVDINLSKFFKRAIDYSISTTIQMAENDWESIKKVLTNLYLFEKKINFNDNQKIGLLCRLVNYFIIKDHLNVATLLALILNHVHDNRFLVKIYRKITK